MIPVESTINQVKDNKNGEELKLISPAQSTVDQAESEVKRQNL